MTVRMMVIMLVGLAIGFVAKFFAIKLEEKEHKNKKDMAWSSVLELTFQMIIIGISFSASMMLSDWDGELKEKENVIEILSRSREFAHEEYKEHTPLIKKYEEDRLTIYQLELFLEYDLEYYNNVIANEDVMRQMDGYTYAQLCKYINYIEVLNRQIENIDKSYEEAVYQQMLLRDAMFGRVITALEIGIAELKGEYTEEEVREEFKKIGEGTLAYKIYDSEELYEKK